MKLYVKEKPKICSDCQCAVHEVVNGVTQYYCSAFDISAPKDTDVINYDMTIRREDCPLIELSPQQYVRHPELTDEYYLIHLAEECAELAQAAIKAARFGIENVHPKTGVDNLTRLTNEFNDVVAIASILGLEVNNTEQIAKGDKVNKYLSQCQDMWKKT